MRYAAYLCLVYATVQIPAAAQLPPLVDRDHYFGEIEIGGAQISPNGQYISFLKPFKGQRNVWVKKAGEPFTAARPVTADTKRPIGGYFWSRDSRFILWVQDNAGDENYNVYAVDPAAPPETETGVPKARDLTNLKGVRVMLFKVPKSDPDKLIVGLNDRDKAWHDVYEVKISTGERKLLRKNTDRYTGVIFDNKDVLRLATRSAENGDTEILRADADKFTKIYSCGVLETCTPVNFDKQNKLVYIENNKGAGIDLIQLELLDPATGQTKLVESDPNKRVDLAGALFSEVTDELIATIYIDDRLRFNWHDKVFGADYKWLQSKLPNRTFSLSSSTRDENIWVLTASSDVEPGETYLFNRKARTLALQYKIREKLPREALSPMKYIKFKSSDGLEIPAYLTLPKGLPPKTLPVILVPHGGPWGRDVWGYNTMHQFLSNRGYAVLSPNFRGSTGYGKKFLDAGNREWGQKMQDDVTWGAKHLIAEGIADPKRVGITGGSYGGYATLAGVAFTPDVYAAAVSFVGPSNLITLLDSIPPYWEQIRKMFHVRMGDPTTAEGKAQLERQSPLNSAAKIKTPLMVVQGANDPRVNKAESDQIVVALRDRKFPVEYLVAPDEGHGFARPINNLARIAAMEKFLARYLDGRFQSGMTPETEKRLKEITVDPATVTLAKKVDASAVGLPALAVAPTPGVLEMKAKIEAGPQTIALEVVSELKQEGGRWIASDIMKTPMGEVRDVSTIDGASYALVGRNATQGPVTIQLEYKDNKASGKVVMSGKETPLNVDLGGPVFADSLHILAALPLGDGYSAMYRTLDVQTMKAKNMQIRVAGSEQVTVPAGTFEAFKVEVEPADGSPGKQTIWIAKSPRKAVKVEAALPQMAGAKLTMELAK